jgi:hypothetical protein
MTPSCTIAIHRLTGRRRVPPILLAARITQRQQNDLLPISASATYRRTFLSPSVRKRLDLLVARHNELQHKMESSPEESFQYGKELASLAQFESLLQKHESLQVEEQSVKDLLNEIQKEDEDLIQECQNELHVIEAFKIKLAKQIQNAVLPKDPDDFQSDAVVEIRAGTGGDEAALFASELRETYLKTAKAMSWECDIMGESRTHLGGIKETVLSISSRSRGDRTSENDAHDDNDEGAIPVNLGPYGSNTKVEFIESNASLSMTLEYKPVPVLLLSFRYGSKKTITL